MSTTERMNFSPDQARECFTKLQEGTEQGIGIDHVDDGVVASMGGGNCLQDENVSLSMSIVMLV